MGRSFGPRGSDVFSTIHIRRGTKTYRRGEASLVRWFCLSSWHSQRHQRRKGHHAWPGIRSRRSGFQPANAAHVSSVPAQWRRAGGLADELWQASVRAVFEGRACVPARAASRVCGVSVLIPQLARHTSLLVAALHTGKPALPLHSTILLGVFRRARGSLHGLVAVQLLA